MKPMHNAGAGLYFQRQPDGSVLVFHAGAQVLLDPTAWCRAVAAVTAAGADTRAPAIEVTAFRRVRETHDAAFAPQGPRHLCAAVRPAACEMRVLPLLPPADPADEVLVDRLAARVRVEHDCGDGTCSGHTDGAAP